MCSRTPHPQNATNEPKLAEIMTIVTIQESIGVTANSGVKSGLDSISIKHRQRDSPGESSRPRERVQPGSGREPARHSISIARPRRSPRASPPRSEWQRPGARMINTSFPPPVKEQSVEVIAATGPADDQHLLPPTCEGGARGVVVAACGGRLKICIIPHVHTTRMFAQVLVITSCLIHNRCDSIKESRLILDKKLTPSS